MFYRITYLLVSFFFLATAFSNVTFVSPVAAQSVISDQVETGALTEDADQVAADRSEEIARIEPNDAQLNDDDWSQRYVQSLQMVLGVCVTKLPDVPEGTSVSIGFDLDQQGQLVGIPEFKSNTEATPDVRRLFLQVAIAIDDCAPFPPARANTRLEAVFSGNGIQSLLLFPDTAGNQSISHQKAALAVSTPASQESEDELGLTRSKRIEIQQRLFVLGFDPKGADGVFGQNTRDTISAWQQDKGFPSTGFLNAVQLLALNTQSQQSYAEFIVKNPTPKKKRRVKICQPIGLFGLQRCQYEYR